MTLIYVYLKGTNYDVRYPYMIISGLTLVGFIAALFLPETLHQKLANTLQEAQKFGKDQVRIYLHLSLFISNHKCILCSFLEILVITTQKTSTTIL